MASSAAAETEKNEAQKVEMPDIERGQDREERVVLEEHEDPQLWKAGKKCSCNPL